MKVPLRIALRVEGEWWKAYVAEPDHMDGALLLAQIHMSLVTEEKGKKRKDMFIAIMKDYLDEFLMAQFGEKSDHWEIDAAPEHERKES